MVPVPDDELPLLLPEVEDYRPKGVPPLASNTEWLHVPCPTCGKPGTREADTMDTFVDSSWYFLRYVDPHSDEAPFGREVVDYWCPIDQYIGGIDHATGHLLYSRFFVKVLNEMGLVGFREPFSTVFHQGWVQLGGTKMSKTKGNVLGPTRSSPPTGRTRCGCTSSSSGPPTRTWSGRTRGSRASRASCAGCGGSCTRSPRARRAAPRRHAARAQDARDDREGHRRHRAAPLVQHRHLRDHGARERALAQHLGSGCALRCGDGRVVDPALRAARHGGAVAGARARGALWKVAWPVADEAMLERDTFELVVQVNGRVRDRFVVPARAHRRRARRAGKGIGQGTALPRRRRGQADGRRARQARQLRRLGLQQIRREVSAVSRRARCHDGRRVTAADLTAPGDHARSRSCGRAAARGPGGSGIRHRPRPRLRRGARAGSGTDGAAEARRPRGRSRP